MSDFIKWIETKALIIISVLAGVLLLIIVGFYVYSVHLNGALDKANLKASQYQDANKQLSDAITAQSKAILQMQLEAAQKAKDAAAAIAAAKKQAEKHLAAAKDVLGYQGSGDQCKDVTDLISSYVVRHK